ncbi:MAG: SpaA isopeptide-forming pilin-related protein [Actinomycetaceae bacterium]|nr:LPXTG cell wall anchor domain-containing protein [Arcanobacterium sp.]MDD7686879.1 SpaA isopeptide-forming pilin-related protein [Actinomycetaceae bacterium]MDY5274030.1 SpaA isopeptide-forming pilin-related protein [Arcanobacterium sp.]
MKKKIAGAVTALCVCCAALIAIALPANAAERPFPKYELSYQWIHGTPDPNYDPEHPVGDGCLRKPDAKVTHLSFFGFNTAIDPCDAIRTTIRFYNNLGPGQEGTNNFRWGVSWQYTDMSDPNSNHYIWKPVENFLFDGQPYPGYDVTNQDAMVVKDAQGNFVRMDNGRGLYEPQHIEFDDFFGDGEEHTFQFDAYLPINGDWAGMSWGTGSTGDTQGGTIGATAQGIFVKFLAGADFRHVEDSVYREFLGIDSDDDPLPARPQGTWGGKVEGTTFSVEQCLEDRMLAPVTDTITANEIYPDLTYSTPIEFYSGAGNYLMASWPYEFMVNYRSGKGQNFDSTSKLRPVFTEGNSFVSYETVRPGEADFSYKPTVDSIIQHIPGYEYVDNDLKVFDDGSVDPDIEKWVSDIPKFVPGKNVYLNYNKSGARIQHLYYTYEPLKTTFSLKKTDDKGAALEGATFELFRAADMKEYLPVDQGGYACKRASTPKLEQIKHCENGNCEQVNVNRVQVPGEDEKGHFSTDEKGAFVPTNADGSKALDWLPAGTYYLREVAAPSGYELLDNPLVFHVTPEKDAQGNVAAVDFNVVNTPDTPPTPPTPDEPTPPTPPTPDEPTPPTPDKPLPNTGSQLGSLIGLAAVCVTAGAFLVRRRQRHI